MYVLQNMQKYIDKSRKKIIQVGSEIIAEQSRAPNWHLDRGWGPEIESRQGMAN